MTLYRGLNLIIILINILVSFQHKFIPCPTEFSTVYENRQQVLWKANTRSYYSVSISKPPCLDANKNLVGRVCLNGTWLTDKDVCIYLQESALCPPEFVEEDKFCNYITEPQTWNRTCPYSGSTFMVKNNNNNSVWMPLKQIVKYGFFEYMLPGELYGKPLKGDYKQENFENDRKCLIKNEDEILASSCDARYAHICSYKYNNFLHSCPHNCIHGGLGSDYCFCKKYNTSYCETIAEPRYAYEQKKLYKLVGSDTCLINNSNFPKSYLPNYHLAIHNSEWSFRTLNEINCAICKIKAILYDKVDMIMKFKAKSNELFLSVYSPDGLLQIDDEKPVYCFTDATGMLKARVGTNQIWDSYSESQPGRRLKVFKVSISDDGPGNYWCEGFQLPSATKITSNTIVAYRKFKDRDYSLRLQIFDYCRFFLADCEFPTVSDVNSMIKLLFKDTFYLRFLKRIRLFHIFDINTKTKVVDILVHVTAKSKLPMVAEYHAILRNLNQLKIRNAYVIYFRSSTVCLPEKTFISNSTLYWKTTAIGAITTPKEICVNANGIPVRRNCGGSFLFGSHWEELNEVCSSNIKLSEKTILLHSIAYKSNNSVIPVNISEITADTTDFTILDLHYLSKALKVTTISRNDSEELINELTQIVDNLMKTNVTTLKQSQALLNVTDEILETLDNSLQSNNISKDIFLLQRGQLIVQISKPFLNNISGLAVYAKEGDSFFNFNVSPLYSNSTLEFFESRQNLEVAVFVPEKLLETVSGNMSLDMQNNFVVVTTIFYDDKLFNSNLEQNNSVISMIVSVSIPEYGEFLETPIPVIFKTTNKVNDRDCAFWNYGLDSDTHSGHWSTLGGNYLGNLNNSSLEICTFSHLTNFALLIRSQQMVDDVDESITYNIIKEEYHDQMLSIISNIGCSFSVIGILGIFTTSLVFQSWRKKLGTKILLQLCVTILLQIVLINLASFHVMQNKSENFCKAVGIVLHYVTISEFTWMLVAAVLQFIRFVQVIGPVPNHLMLKSILIGWVMPFIPVILVCTIDLESYSYGIQGICYPKGLSMYLGVILPITIIVITNMVVFICVIRNIFNLKVESHGTSKTILKRQICLAILLFFLLGIPWMFGLLSDIVHSYTLSYIFIYLFCTTATLQGFVLFIFYVIFDKCTRTMWFQLFKNLCNSKYF